MIWETIRDLLIYIVLGGLGMLLLALIPFGIVFAVGKLASIGTKEQKRLAWLKQHNPDLYRKEMAERVAAAKAYGERRKAEQLAKQAAKPAPANIVIPDSIAQKGGSIEYIDTQTHEYSIVHVDKQPDGKLRVTRY